MDTPDPAHRHPGPAPVRLHGPLPSRRADAGEMVLRLHGELLPVLAAYPVDGFLHDYLAAWARDDPSHERQRDLLLRLLQQWSDLLWRDMVQLPAGGHEVVLMLRRRMGTARQALLRLHEAIEALDSPMPA